MTSNLKTIFWNKATHSRINTIPENCQIIISAEHNIFLAAGDIGFHLVHSYCGMNLAATFLWDRRIKRWFNEDNIKYFEGNRYPLIDELIVIKVELIETESALFTTDIYKEGVTEIGEIIKPVRELPIINWTEKEKNTPLKIPDECIVNFPKKYNWFQGVFDTFIRISNSEYQDHTEDQIILTWHARTARILPDIKSNNRSFKMFENPDKNIPLRSFWPVVERSYTRYLITDKNILGIQLEMTFEIDSKFRIIRRMKFRPIEAEKKDDDVMRNTKNKDIWNWFKKLK